MTFIFFVVGCNFKKVCLNKLWLEKYYICFYVYNNSMTKTRLLTYSLTVVVVALISSGLLSGVPSEFNIFDNNSFAQTSVTSNEISVLSTAAAQPTGADTNKTVQFNRYENSDFGISLKYPSNFLIDESNSDEKLQQISFFPPANTSMTQEQPILWMGVFIQSLSPVSGNASSPSTASNLNIETYAESLANSIQQGNEDITVIEKSTNTLLSGHPAYKLVTQSYYNNSAIIDVQIGTIFNNKHYSINYMTEMSNYFNSLPVANEVIKSFDINELAPITSKLNQLGSDSDSNATAETGSFLGSILSYFKLDELSNKPSGVLDNLKTSLANSVNSVLNSSGNQVPPNVLNRLETSLANSVNSVLNSSKNEINKSLANQSLPSQPSSLPSQTMEQVCHLPLMSKVCGFVGSSGGGENISDSGALNNSTSFNSEGVRESLEKSLNNLLGGMVEIPGSPTR
jgi:hypothetical protein